MADWLDRWARRAARPTDAPNSPDGARQLSRRQLLKRAGVVAGATWTVPMIQTALAPPAAASGAGPGLPGSPCTSGTQCNTGYCDPTGVCGSPTVFWAGHGCTTNSDCWSLICLGGVCKPGPLAGTCSTAADCQNNINCTANGQTCGGPGASCQNNNKCVSGSCLPSGVCA